MGLSLDAFPSSGIAVRESPTRTDERGNRVQVQRMAGSDGILVTVLPGRAEAISRVVRQLTPAEMFSPLGAAELSRALGVDFEPNEYYTYGYNYVLSGADGFRPAATEHAVTPLTRKDLPPEQAEMRMRERRASEGDDFVWAFACRHDDPGFRAGDELAPFGSRCAAIAIVIWQDGPVAWYGVGADAACRGQGYGLAAVSAATGWILEQGEAVIYQAYANNIPSLRIARRLGFTWLQQEMEV